MINLLLAQLKIPTGNTTDPQDVPIPPGLQSNPVLNTGLEGAGTKYVQVIYQSLFSLGVIIVVIFMMYAGIKWITSGGDPTKIADAKKKMTYSVLGLVIISGAYFIVRVIIYMTTGNSEIEFF
jgi:hypothetical protein